MAITRGKPGRRAANRHATRPAPQSPPQHTAPSIAGLYGPDLTRVRPYATHLVPDPQPAYAEPERWPWERTECGTCETEQPTYTDGSLHPHCTDGSFCDGGPTLPGMSADEYWALVGGKRSLPSMCGSWDAGDAA